VAVLSVSRPRVEALRERCASLRDVRLRVLGEDGPLPIEVRVRRPEQVGHDRLANAAAAHVRARGAAVVADVGTAITVDAVDASGAFRGGAIGPGPRAALEGLRARAPHLPDPGDLDPSGALGETTREAMASALRFAVAGGIDRLLEEVASALGGAPALFLTGGGGPAILPTLRTRPEPVPDLTLEGIRELARRWTSRSRRGPSPR
jgi:type III pantothenate kinase